MSVNYGIWKNLNLIICLIVPATMWSDGPLMAGNKSTQEFARTEAKIPIFVDEQYMSNERSKTEDDQVGSKDLKPGSNVYYYLISVYLI